ncbi:hypothetical protein DUNSADRAFT_1417, partial [Dunaliella salina]
FADHVGRLAQDPTVLPSIITSIMSDARVLGETISKALVSKLCTEQSTGDMDKDLNKLADEMSEDPMVMRFTATAHVIRLYANARRHSGVMTVELPNNNYSKVLVMSAMTLEAYQVMLRLVKAV